MMTTVPHGEPVSDDNPSRSPSSAGNNTELAPLKIKGLPPGWRREVVVRKNGQSAGKTDVYYYSPCGKKFRSKPQIARFLGECADLSPFDFSRAGTPGDGTQRRRARDRSAKKFDIIRPVPLVRPLSNNPLRPSGPIRRTCGVIKLPVTWIYVPTPSNEENDETAPPKLTNSKETTETEEKPATISALPLTAGGNSVAVPALWENRLLGVKACDHETGDDIVPTTSAQNGILPAVINSPTLMHTLTGPSLLPKVSTRPIVPGITNSFQKLASAIRSPPSLSPSVTGVTASLLAQQLQKSLTQAVGMGGASTVIPSLLQVSPSVVTLKNGQSKSQDTATSHLTGNDIVFLSLAKTVQPGKRKTHVPISSTHVSSRKANGPPSSVGEKKVLENLSRLITDNDLRLQEEKVRHLRQQLLAAERN